MDRVISAARDAGCHLEINAEPDRLDLNDIHAHAAKTMGVKVGDFDGRALGRTRSGACGSASIRRGVAG